MVLHVLGLVAALGAPAGGELDRAQKEIAEQLQQTVRTPAPQLDVEFEGVDASRYALNEASFSLDGAELPVEAGGRRIFRGEVKPGKHELDVRLVYTERKGLGIFTYADAKLTVEGTLGVKAVQGLLMRLRLRVVSDPKADPRHRLKLASDLGEEMLAAVDDSVGDLLAVQKPWQPPAPVPVPPSAATNEPARAEAGKPRRYVREVLGLKSRSAPTAQRGSTPTPTPTPIPTP
ncbi:MAG TPA: hypothetical protein VMB50_17295, partial [Myxococcales bacterium]|nr:hypothetical protein [Myxococcales bacterium]